MLKSYPCVVEVCWPNIDVGKAWESSLKFEQGCFSKMLWGVLPGRTWTTSMPLPWTPGSTLIRIPHCQLHISKELSLSGISRYRDSDAGRMGHRTYWTRSAWSLSWAPTACRPILKKGILKGVRLDTLSEPMMPTCSTSSYKDPLRRSP